MMNRFYKHAAAAAVAVCLAGSLSAPAGAVCYFGECTTGSITSTAPSPAPQKAVKVAEHSSWRAIAYGDYMYIVDDFVDGSMFALVDAGPQVGLQMANDSWHLVPGQSYKMKITIDGQVFSGLIPVKDKNTLGYEDVPSDFIAAFRDGHTAHIEIEQLFNGDIQSLADAKATVADGLRYKKTAM